MTLNKLRKDEIACPWDDRQSFVVAQLSLLWWQIWDHYRWLQEISWASGDPKQTKRIAFYGFVLSSSVSSLYYLKRLAQPTEELATNETKRNKEYRQTLKHLVTVVSTLHISELYMAGEMATGACGAVASAVDIYEGFPKKNAKQN